MTPTRVSIIVVACTAAVVAASQAPSEPPRFRVAVDVVSIDAVVTDRKGEVVRDLTAADFEVFQDGKRQKVTFAQFVPVITVAAPAVRAIGSSAIPASAGSGDAAAVGAADHARAGAADDCSRRRRSGALRRRHEQYPTGVARVRRHRTAADGPRRDRPDGRVDGCDAVADERSQGARGGHRRDCVTTSCHARACHRSAT